MKILMKYKKSTKGSHVFTECTSDGQETPYGVYKIGTLYIRKSAMPTAANLISVTVEVPN